MTQPIRIMIGYLPNVSKKDAIEYARGWVARYFDAIDQSYVHVQPYLDGFAFEIHEGGLGKAYLPSVLKLISEGEKVNIPTATRMTQITVAESGLVTLMLPEDVDVEPTPGVSTGPSMRPYQGDARAWLVAGGGVFVIGMLVLALGAAVWNASQSFYQLGMGSLSGTDAINTTIKLTREPNAPKTSPLARLQQLPVAQWQKITETVTDGQYVTALRFKNNVWRFDQAERVIEQAPSDEAFAGELPGDTGPADWSQVDALASRSASQESP